MRINELHKLTISNFRSNQSDKHTKDLLSLLITMKSEFSFNNLIEYRNGTFFDYRKHFCQHVVIVPNYFCHEFETVSCTYPYFKIASFSPYRINHLNELIQIPPSHLLIYRMYGNTIPRNTKFSFKKMKNTFYTF